MQYQDLHGRGDLESTIVRVKDIVIAAVTVQYSVYLDCTGRSIQYSTV